MSPLDAVLVMVGAVLLGHLTELSQVTVRLPVASCLSIIMNDWPATAVGKVMVALPVSVMIWTVPLAKLSVMAVELLALYGVST